MLVVPLTSSSSNTLSLSLNGGFLSQLYSPESLHFAGQICKEKSFLFFLKCSRLLTWWEFWSSDGDDVWGFHNQSALNDEALRALQKKKTESRSDARKKLTFHLWILKIKIQITVLCKIHFTSSLDLNIFLLITHQTSNLNGMSVDVFHCYSCNIPRPDSGSFLSGDILWSLISVWCWVYCWEGETHQHRRSSLKTRRFLLPLQLPGLIKRKNIIIIIIISFSIHFILPKTI